MTEAAPRWWQQGVIYEVYPRSFQDSDGDGVGDLSGVIARLDYLQWLGVDALWLAPIYPSPMADFGYDVADYTNIHPLFGSLADFDRLVAEAHRRRLRVVLDFVPNHTSDQHPWFVESRRSRQSPKRNWYLWRDPAPDGGPPNNWRSSFGGSAWEWDQATAQYYYHAFLSAQPDLNWRNQDVQRAMLDVLRFWLDRGVDGFRVDVIWHLIKDENFRNNPPNPSYEPGTLPYHELQATYNADQPEVHEVIATMRELLERYGQDRLLVGEIYLPVERVVAYYGTQGRGVHLPFNFQLIDLPWQPWVIKQAVDRYEQALPMNAWPNWVLGNHDKHRLASRVGAAQARVAAMLLLGLRGTPTLYYGDEIGMHDVPIPPDRIVDPLEKNLPGLGVGRDPARTPMQWDASANAGFTAARPWLPLAADHETVNVACQRDDPHSLLNLYRALIALRQRHRALSIGDYEPTDSTGNVFAFARRGGSERFFIALNVSDRPETCAVPARGRVALSTQLDRQGEAVETRVALRANEGVIIELR